MKKEKKSVAATNAVTKIEKTSCISISHLAKFFEINRKSMVFAVAEIETGEDDVVITPVVALLGRSEFISLRDGNMCSNAQAQGYKQNLYAARVSYNKHTDVFTFTATVGAKTSIRAQQLIDNFGARVIKQMAIV